MKARYFHNAPIVGVVGFGGGEYSTGGAYEIYLC